MVPAGSLCPSPLLQGPTSSAAAPSVSDRPPQTEPEEPRGGRSVAQLTYHWAAERVPRHQAQRVPTAVGSSRNPVPPTREVAAGGWGGTLSNPPGRRGIPQPGLQVPAPDARRAPLSASEAKANHGQGGRAGRNRKPLTETLLIKEIPPPPNPSMEG